MHFYAPTTKSGGHIDLPLSVRPSVCPSQNVCVALNSKTICNTDLKRNGYIIQKRHKYYNSGCELVHQGIFIRPKLTFTELWSLI